MLKAWNAGRLGPVLGQLGLAAAIRRRLMGSEVALVSSVLGRISYLTPELQRGFFEEADLHPVLDQDWPSLPAEAPVWTFWPGYRPAPGDGTSRQEVSAVARWGGWVLVIEAKHRSAQRADWRLLLRGVAAEEEISPDRLVFLALGGWDAERDAVRARAVHNDPALTGAGVFRSDWTGVRDGLERLRADEGIARGQRAILDDAARLLLGVGGQPKRGLGSLPRALRDIGEFAEASAFAWRPTDSEERTR